MEEFSIYVAGKKELEYLTDIEQGIINASMVKGTGIAVRTNEYIKGKILDGKSVIAVHSDGSWAGFCRAIL